MEKNFQGKRAIDKVYKILYLSKMKNEQFTSVWDVIEDTPEEAENMKLCSALMSALKEHIASAGLSQAQAAKFECGV